MSVQEIVDRNTIGCPIDYPFVFYVNQCSLKKNKRVPCD